MSDMTPHDIAKAAYEQIQEDAPARVPKWDQLYAVERDQLVRFAISVLELTSNA